MHAITFSSLSIIQCESTEAKDGELIQPQSEGSTSGYHSASVSVDGHAGVPTDRPENTMILLPSTSCANMSQLDKTVLLSPEQTEHLSSDPGMIE